MYAKRLIKLPFKSRVQSEICEKGTKKKREFALE